MIIDRQLIGTLASQCNSLWCARFVRSLVNNPSRGYLIEDYLYLHWHFLLWEPTAEADTAIFEDMVMVLDPHRRHEAATLSHPFLNFHAYRAHVDYPREGPYPVRFDALEWQFQGEYLYWNQFKAAVKTSIRTKGQVFMYGQAMYTPTLRVVNGILSERLDWRFL